MFTSFFVNRPIFASVISIFIVIVGVISIPQLPVEQTPDITPPTISVSAQYPGASASTIAETVATPLEEEINGIQDVLYISSKSNSDGTLGITVTFDIGVDTDMATVLVQNKVAVAEPGLPEEVKRYGIVTQKRSTNITLFVSLISPKGTLDEIYLSNYANLYITDAIKRVPGVGDVNVFGEKDFSMRIWLDPEKMKARNVTTNDVINAISNQNVEVAAGIVGAPPSPKGQQFQYTINTKGRLSDAKEFEDIIVKVTPEGDTLYVRDIARIELGSAVYNSSATLNGSPTIAIGIYQLPGANALEVADGIRKVLRELEDGFPEDMEYTIPYDPTLFISASVKEVLTNLFITVFLVILTVYVFLQDFRTTLIPAVTIPVSLIGTFAVMLVLGISINTITLFGLLLAIGVVVDDSIVVVENTMRIIDEEKLSAKAAARKSMRQITAPCIATTLVLLAVFVPTGMISGISGRLYNQFAITISAATVFSSINALTLSPALCGILLRPTKTRHGLFFRMFNKLVGNATNGYVSIVSRTTRKFSLMLAIYAIFGFGTLVCFKSTPSGFIPDEDQGFVFINIELPDAATLERTDEVKRQVEAMIKQIPEVKNVVAIGGYSLINGISTTNAAAMFVELIPWDQRQGPEHHVNSIVGRMYGIFTQIPDAVILAFIPPPVSGLGVSGGFEMQLQDRENAGLLTLQDYANRIVDESEKSPVVSRLNSALRADFPQLELIVDREKTMKLGVNVLEVFQTLQTYLGSSYVNDFNLFGRVFQVKVQADAQFRDKIGDIKKLEVRNDKGNMIPLSTFVKIKEVSGPQTISHFNLYSSTQITGQPTEGYSTGQAISEMEKIIKEITPSSIGVDYSGVTYQELKAGNTAPFIFGMAVLFVVLFLAAQYESWTIPFAIVFTIPVAILGGIGLTFLNKLDNNVYTQIGFVLLVALASKNAILLVEFAKQLHEEEGMSIFDAAVFAARQRFRPIQMTAFTFILGALPLLFASGAGAASRKALGTVVFGGMVMGSMVGIFFIPAFYVMLQTLAEKFSKKGADKENPTETVKLPEETTPEQD
ncbi:MAG: efflux RND transporter permease subunit [Sedimentisphaeraceae bacterium JB056]